MAINYNNHNITTSGSITSPSGNFTTLLVNGTTINNFNSSVSGLLPVKSITAGTGIYISSNNNDVFTINSTSTGGSSSSGAILEYISPSGFPATGTGSIIYIATDSSRLYRWNGSCYNEIGPIGGGDTNLWSLFLPPAPTGLSTSIGDSEITLSWFAPIVLSQTPIIDYSIQYSSNSGNSWTTFSDSISTATSRIVTGLTNNIDYIFRVAGINAIGTGIYSASSSTATPGSSALVASISFLAIYPSSASSEYTISGSGTSSSPIIVTIGGIDNADNRVWLSVSKSGTLYFNLTAYSEDDYDGGRLYSTSSSPSQHSYLGLGGSPPAGYTALSSWVDGVASSSGSVSVSSGLYVVVQYSKDSSESAGNDNITANLYIV